MFERKIKIMEFLEAQYIIDYFPRLMNEAESKAKRHHFFSFKLRTPDTYHNPNYYFKRKKMYERYDRISNDPNVLKLLENGYEKFVIQTAKRIQNNTLNQFKINRCPKCNFVARTPYAKQCIQCKHDWHDEIAAALWFESAIKITGRPYLWITGELSRGHLKVGYKVDLTFFQLNIVRAIKQIEFCLKSINGEKREVPSLGIEVSGDEEKLIQNYLKPSPMKTVMILK